MQTRTRPRFGAFVAAVGGLFLMVSAVAETPDYQVAVTVTLGQDYEVTSDKLLLGLRIDPVDPGAPDGAEDG